MFFIGDVHGDFPKYKWLLDQDPLPESFCHHTGAYEAIELDGIDCSLQVGYLGLFSKYHDNLVLDSEHRFFRGNHDNPHMCQKHPNYIGDYGYISEMDMFWLGGGFSIDREYRTSGVDWWEGEELKYGELMGVLECYGDSKPKIMVSHECPTCIKVEALTNILKIDIMSRTEACLQSMFEIHQPDIWIFGHHHKWVDRKLDGTRFVGLEEMLYGHLPNCCFEIPGLEWAN